MALAIYNFHRVLIVAATAFFAALAVYAFRRYGSTPDPATMAMAVGGVVAAVIGVVYFIYFNIKLYRGQPHGPVR